MTPAQQRYIKNRARIIQAQKDRHQRDMECPTYAKLIAVRKTIDNLKRSIALYRTKIRLKQTELARWTWKKEELEMQWGHIRSSRKRAIAKTAETADNGRHRQK